MTMQHSVSTDLGESIAVSALPSKALQLAFSLFLGAVILYGIGFIETSTVHNAAHDMRHSQGFPCH